MTLEEQLKKVQVQQESLLRVLDPKCGGVSNEQLGSLALQNLQTGEYVQYIDHQFVDVNGAKVEMSVSDIGAVEWLLGGEDLAGFYARKEREVPTVEKPEVVVALEAENLVLKEKIKDLEAKIKDLEAKIKDLVSENRESATKIMALESKIKELVNDKPVV